ncbi:helix-turn-helix domain-containing protein [Arenibacter sp. TNZ]|uniref:helix-turn-helix domain-containing protein n=1 Tax=Arenibacter TaxID=178469 RepID=UPI000CD3EE18|nr:MULTISPECIES: helix-turn-helix domain-containing protein [Arenibacter]MCM4171827.1 helix-turn-helix domain-containing protein [Arenibacter sp. TNZ]
MKPEERNFQGIWIPRVIYLNSDANWYAKILFLEIHSFTESGRECFMSNRHIATFLHISERQVTRYISELKTLGWIEETAFNGRRRYLKSLLRFNDRNGGPGRTKMSGQPGQFCRGSMVKSVHHNKQGIKQEIKQFTFLKEEKNNRSPILE